MMMVLAAMVLVPYALKLYSSQQSTAVRPYALKRNACVSMRDNYHRKTLEQEGRHSDPNRPLEHRPNQWVLKRMPGKFRLKQWVQMPTEIDKAVGTGVADPLGKTTSG